MFRKMRRFAQQVSEDECLKILKEEPRGVLAVLGDEGYPYTVPMDFVYDNGKIYFHCAKEGHKIDAINSYDKVSFCVMNKGFKKSGEWALNITSVVVFGRISIVQNNDFAEEKLRFLGLKYYPNKEDVEEEMRKAAKRACVLELNIEHMTGKLVNES